MEGRVSKVINTKETGENSQEDTPYDDKNDTHIKQKTSERTKKRNSRLKEKDSRDADVIQSHEAIEQIQSATSTP